LLRKNGSTLLYLQLIVQLQAQIPPGSEKSDILKKPERLLIFIKGALEAAFSKAQSQQSRRPEARPLGLHHLHIVDEPVARDSEDSDDEDESTGDEEIASTAIDLLLSILESEYTSCSGSNECLLTHSSSSRVCPKCTSIERHL
jgi:hypothetical protein